ncbi:BlaI/MecI/CopY family transcriptional regulator [Ulvibacterium marinum]|uniref:BlaI/MecI/CopY family transcriptional regulator n=1 Tax=Ulvibacterium marinum TaxID=2419782 RepID=UPI00249449D7|nr:BlaI/MecI/CopY family transcriptional regulator [Ulvibacterium marinum]
MDKIRLDELQLKIMHVLWQEREASVAEIKDALTNKGNPAITTVSTVLSRLQKKGIVSYRKQGKQYIYKADVPENKVKHSMVSMLVERLFHGNTTSLMNFLVAETDLDTEEIRELRKKVDRST